jgi:GT2 family glycosyltransferase
LETPKISIIIGIFNCLPLTRECLRSLSLTLEGWDYEVILIDDGSTDGTREWLATLTHPFRVILNDKNQGFARNNNAGARLARGDVLLLLNNDVILEPGWLEPMWDLLHRIPRTGVVGNVQKRVSDGSFDHFGIGFDHKGKPFHHVHPKPTWPGRPWGIYPAVTGACLLIRRDLFLDVGGFDPAFRNGGEDVDLCFKVRSRGLHCRTAYRSIIHHHVSASPGRNLFHEANCRLLFHRWREEIISAAAPSWPRQYLRHQRIFHPTESVIMPAELLQAILCSLQLWKVPPAARAFLEDNLDLEERRWQEILGPLEPS